MSGPALKQLGSHRAIHDAAYGEADELTNAIRKFAKAGKKQAVNAVARLLVEHWQTRTLRHAADEEEGLYQEIAAQYPEHVQDIAVLKRDHDLMRELVTEVEELLTSEGSSSEMIDRFQMLLWLVEKHSREEEKRLLAVGHAVSNR